MPELQKAAQHFGFRRPKMLFEQTPRRAFDKRMAKLKDDRSYFLTEWRDISDYIHPRRGRYLSDGQDAKKPRRSNLVLNNSVSMASRTLGSGMMSGISSPARPWFKLTTPSDPGLIESGPVKGWIKVVSEKMRMIFAMSNFYDSVQMLYRDLGDFGNGVMIIDEDYEDVIRCTTLAPGEYFLASSHRNNVNTVYREHSYTVLQMVDKFGDACSDQVINMYDAGNYDTLIDVVTVIEPNFGQVTDGMGASGAPFINCCYEAKGDGGPDRKPLMIRPYHEWAAPAPRWDLQAGEVYGSGCGIMALPDARGLQTLERRKAQAIDKLVTPTMKAPPSMKQSGATHIPGGVTYATASSPHEMYSPAYEVPATGITAIAQEIERHERRGDEAYYKDLFLMLSQSDRREITAREVEEKHEEKLLALGPVLERTHNELLNVAIDRTFAIAHRAGLFPPAPKELEGVNLKVKYISILAQAQEAVAIGAMERVTGFIGNLVAVFPSVGDKLDSDQLVDEYSDAAGVVSSIIRSDDDVAKMRDERAKQQQPVDAMAQMSAGADTAKVLADAKMSEPNLLNQLLNAQGASGA